MMGTLIALAGCASQPGVFLTSWRISVTSAVLFWMSGMCVPSRDVQQAPRGAVGAGGRRSGHVRGVHHNGVASFGVVDADARARELAVESALDAGSLAIIGRLRAVAAARRALGSGSVVRRRRQAVRANAIRMKRCSSAGSYGKEETVASFSLSRVRQNPKTLLAG